jgi:hypothetical protein
MRLPLGPAPSAEGLLGPTGGGQNLGCGSPSLAPCLVGEEYLGIAAHGWGKYRFCLEHPMARIGFTDSRHLPSVRVQPRAEYLHGRGPNQLLDDLQYLLEPEGGPLCFSVSRLDLFVDVQGWSLMLDDAHRFVCRADARRMHEAGGTLTGFEFGTRKTKTICARIYDKSADIEVRGTTWWHDVWEHHHVDGSPVHRIEFELGRQGLVDFGVDTPAQALGATGDIWCYATGEWLTHRSPTLDRTRSRWPLSPEWCEVQQASLSHRAVGLKRLHETRRQASIAKLLPGLTGYLASLAALTGADDTDDTATRVAGHHV